MLEIVCIDCAQPIVPNGSAFQDAIEEGLREGRIVPSLVLEGQYEGTCYLCNMKNKGMSPDYIEECATEAGYIVQRENIES